MIKTAAYHRFSYRSNLRGVQGFTGRAEHFFFVQLKTSSRLFISTNQSKDVHTKWAWSVQQDDLFES